jgi:hypothetical protein
MMEVSSPRTGVNFLIMSGRAFWINQGPENNHTSNELWTILNVCKFKFKISVATRLLLALYFLLQNRWMHWLRVRMTNIAYRFLTFTHKIKIIKLPSK